MRTKAFLITGCIMILFTGVLFAQESEAEHNALHSKMQYSPITGPVAVKKCLDSVFPRAIFQYETNLYRRGDHNGTLEAVYKDKTYLMPEGFNSLISELYDSNSQKIRTSDETLIKAFVYLTFLSQCMPVNVDLNLVEKFMVVKVDSKYPRSDIKGIPEELKNFNYKIIVDFRGQDGENYWKHAEMFYRIQNKKIQFGYGFIES